MSEVGEPKKPEGFEDALGEYETLYWDSSCKEPIMWGWRIVRKLGEEDFARLKSVAEVECIGPNKVDGGNGGIWVVIGKWLTAEEAVLKYGAITHIESGPRGAWKATTYGKTTFSSRHMSPATMQKRAMRSAQRKR